jgi:hypothetical protein
LGEDVKNSEYTSHETQYLQDRKVSNSFDIISEFIKIFIANMNTQEKSLKKKIYKVGDFGPAGGIICYDKGYYSEGWRFIERAPPESEFEAPWGAYGIDIPDTKTDIGYGKRNTQFFVEYFKSKGGGLALPPSCVTISKLMGMMIGIGYAKNELIHNRGHNGLLTEEHISSAGNAAYFGGADSEPGYLEAKQWLEAINRGACPLVKPEEAFIVTKIFDAVENIGFQNTLRGFYCCACRLNPAQQTRHPI